MNDLNLEVVILAGGMGTRLWPASYGGRPKQFLPLLTSKTLLEQAIDRAKAVVLEEHIWIVTLTSQVPEILKILPSFDPARVLGEPIGKNSAAAITSAAFLIESIRKEPSTLLYLTSDHFISDIQRFRSDIMKGIRRASDGESLVTFGLKTGGPSTEYGYIEAGPTRRGSNVRVVKRFIEKPKLSLAKKYFSLKRFFWNSGMFSWRTDFFKKEMEHLAPKVFNPLLGVDWKSPYLKDQLALAYNLLPNISIDYALMEKSANVEVMPSNFQWSDLGNWASVFEASPKKKKNALHGEGAVLEGQGNFIYTEGKPVYVFGVDNLVVVEGEKAAMVTTREKSKDLKRFLQMLNLI